VQVKSYGTDYNQRKKLIFKPSLNNSSILAKKKEKRLKEMKGPSNPHNGTFLKKGHSRGRKGGEWL